MPDPNSARGLRVLLASSEIQPLTKTGGLADVAASLGAALRDLGCDLRLLMPAYPAALEKLTNPNRLASMAILGAPESVSLWSGVMPDSGVPVYLVDAPGLFDRQGNPYTNQEGQDWPDNATRFATLGRVIALLAGADSPLDWQPDIVHCNDWQTGLAPALIAARSQRPGLVFTIHNLSFPGLFDWPQFEALQLPHSLWTPDAMEFYGRFAFIKGGLVYADQITTVSPTYAEEICTPAFGYGFEGLLSYRRDRLSGILNGADYSVWSPQSDPLIAASYDAGNLEGKRLCRAALQTEVGLPVDEQCLLIGMVGRLTEQKGIDLVLELLPWLSEQAVQLVLIGSGEARFESALRHWSERLPARIQVRIGYDEGLAHRIEAGADLFLMPSRFEPCGLNQIYSLRYGTPPLVRATGGLADTVVDAQPKALQDDTATGFSFSEASAEALQEALSRAITLYRHPRVWTRLVRAGMRQDFGWRESARAYLEVYRRAQNGRD